MNEYKRVPEHWQDHYTINQMQVRLIRDELFHIQKLLAEGKSEQVSFLQIHKILNRVTSRDAPPMDRQRDAI